jgi:hypothetical protein
MERSERLAEESRSPARSIAFSSPAEHDFRQAALVSATHSNRSSRTESVEFEDSSLRFSRETLATEADRTNWKPENHSHWRYASGTLDVSIFIKFQQWHPAPDRICSLPIGDLILNVN